MPSKTDLMLRRSQSASRSTHGIDAALIAPFWVRPSSTDDLIVRSTLIGKDQGLARPTTSSLPTLCLRQDVHALHKAAQGRARGFWRKNSAAGFQKDQPSTFPGQRCASKPGGRYFGLTSGLPPGGRGGGITGMLCGPMSGASGVGPGSTLAGGWMTPPERFGWWLRGSLELQLIPSSGSFGTAVFGWEPGGMAGHPRLRKAAGIGAPRRSGQRLSRARPEGRRR